MLCSTSDRPSGSRPCSPGARSTVAGRAMRDHFCLPSLCFVRSPRRAPSIGCTQETQSSSRSPGSRSSSNAFPFNWMELSRFRCWERCQWQACRRRRCKPRCGPCSRQRSSDNGRTRELGSDRARRGYRIHRRIPADLRQRRHLQTRRIGLSPPHDRTAGRRLGGRL